MISHQVLLLVAIDALQEDDLDTELEEDLLDVAAALLDGVGGVKDAHLCAANIEPPNQLVQGLISNLRPLLQCLLVIYTGL